MDKPAYVILHLDKAQPDGAFWFGVIDLADQRTLTEAGSQVMVSLRVKSYSMEDHQFIRVRADFEKGKELQVVIPRKFVAAVFESKAELSDAFSFVGKTKK